MENTTAIEYNTSKTQRTSKQTNITNTMKSKWKNDSVIYTPIHE